MHLIARKCPIKITIYRLVIFPSTRASGNFYTFQDHCFKIPGFNPPKVGTRYTLFFFSQTFLLTHMTLLIFSPPTLEGAREAWLTYTYRAWSDGWTNPPVTTASSATFGTTQSRRDVINGLTKLSIIEHQGGRKKFHVVVIMNPREKLLHLSLWFWILPRVCNVLRRFSLQSIRIWIRHPRNRRLLKEDCFIFAILTVFIAGLICICLLGYGSTFICLTLT